MSLLHPLENYKSITKNKVQLCEDIYGFAQAAIIEQLALQYHWFVLADDGYIELYLDNQMMQDFRACEAYFTEVYLKKLNSPYPVWFLHLGIAVHKMMEIYYLYRKSSQFTKEKWIGGCAPHIWNALNMEQFKEVPEYKILGGLIGFGYLLFQYAQYFHIDNERFRVVGAELYFGKSREVPLHTNNFSSYSPFPFRLYLSGKIDLLVDDGTSIVPFDHKTMKLFAKKNPQNYYEMNEGLTGYIFAARSLVNRFNELSEIKIQRKPASKIWMNYLQITPTSADQTIADRFKRIPLFKTDVQLEDYRIRQIATAQRILNLLIYGEYSQVSTNEYRYNVIPVYNNRMCEDWMHRTCPFKQVHRLGSTDHQTILNSAFVPKEWKPEEPTETDNQIGDVRNVFELQTESSTS